MSKLESLRRPDLKPTIIVPCYNEAARLSAEGFSLFSYWPGLQLLFVNDGSKDDTEGVLRALTEKIHGSQFYTLSVNSGKAEAVRQGMLLAMERGAGVVGYFDADLSTPPEEMVGIINALDPTRFEVALGSRVKLLGREIERQASRHYLGRVFATAASMALGLPVYDTQCGAKAFLASPALKDALSEKFSSRWAFDVELLGRLSQGRPGVEAISVTRFIEIPLHRWIHVKGSKIRLSDFPKMAWDLFRIWRKLAHRRRNSRQ